MFWGNLAGVTLLSYHKQVVRRWRTAGGLRSTTPEELSNGTVGIHVRRRVFGGVPKVLSARHLKPCTERAGSSLHCTA